MSRLRIVPFVLVLLLPGLALAGKKEDERIAELEARVAALEKTVAAMDGVVQQKIDTAIAEMAQRDQRAAQLAQQISITANRGDQAKARALLDEFEKKYAGTDAEKRLGPLKAELEVVGKSAPAQFAVEKWYQGADAFSGIDGPGTSLLVFFEEWCPHCKREVPKIESTFEKFKDRGLKVVALTKVTRGATDEKVESFIKANNLEFPVAKETGALSSYFGVSGIPAAAVVKDGKVVWRGHPARLTDGMIESWL